MRQDQLLTEAYFFVLNNLYNDTILELIIELLDNLANEMQEDGYTKESNTLNTCLLSLKEIQANI